MDIEIWALIRRLYFRDHLTRRKIAQQLRVSRNTVRRAIEMETVQAAEREKRGSILDPYKPTIETLLKEYPSLNALRIQEEIQKQGFQGSITLLRKYLRKVRPRTPKVFARLHFEPAEAFQVDWAHAGSIAHEGMHRRLNAFLMVACFSRMLYVEFTLSANTEDFLRCHQNAFQFFQGVFRVGIYDNLKSAVLFRIGKEVHFHPKLIEFSSFYLFEPRACRPRNPQEKGRVENAVRYLRSSFLSGRTFHSFAQLQAEAIRWRDEVANVRVHRTTLKRPIDLFEKEKALLRNLPPLAYDTRITRTVKVTHQCRVRFESNTYSVPPPYAAVALTLKASPKEVVLFHGSKEVAKHRRVWGKGKDVVDPQHERALRETKRRVHLSLQERDFRNLSPEAGAYLEGLSRSALSPSIQMRKILGLVHLYGKVEVAQAIQRALAYQAFGFEYIQNIVFQQRNQSKFPAPSQILLPQREELQTHGVEQRSLEEYENLLEERREWDGKAKEDSPGQPS